VDEKESGSGRIFGLGTWGVPFGHERPRVSRSALYHGESSVEATTSMTWVLTSNVGKGSAGARRGSVCHPTRKGGASAFWRSTPPSTLIGRPEAKVGGDTARGSVFRPIYRGGGKEEGGSVLRLLA